MKAPQKSPRHKAIVDLQQVALGLDDAQRFDKMLARIAADTVFYRLTEPDRVMLEYGAAELLQSLPKDTPKAYARNLAAVMWRAMLEAAR